VATVVPADPDAAEKKLPAAFLAHTSTQVGESFSAHEFLLRYDRGGPGAPSR
jgi:hypothetical protein